MIVEFSGCTSVGKTRLLNKVLELASRKGLPLVPAYNFILGRKSPRYESKLLSLAIDCFMVWTLPRALLHHGPYVRQCIGLALKRRDSFFKRLNIIRNFIKKLWMFDYLSRHDDPGSIVVIDEGPVHCLNNIFAHHDLPPDFEKLVQVARNLPVCERIVWIDAPIVDIVRRAMHRKDPPRKQLTAFQWQQLAEHTSAVYERIAIRKLNVRTTLKIMNSDASDDKIAQRAEKIIDFIFYPVDGTEALKIHLKTACKHRTIGRNRP